jgi:hypothetical protein
MATQDEDVIRTWLETNFAEALKKGDDAVVEFRAQVAAMGPEVVAVLQGIEGTTATVSASVGESLATMGVKLEEATGTGEGESGTGGFAGLAANVMKAEKVLSGLAGGSGFGRMGGMLESITGALGLAGGAGMAAGGLIFAFKVLVPKVQAFIDKMDGAAEATKRATEALKEHEAQVKKNQEAVDKLMEAPTDEEEATTKAINALLKTPEGKRARGGIFASLAESGAGAMTDTERSKLFYSEQGPLGRFSQANDPQGEAFRIAVREQELKNLNAMTDAMLLGLRTNPEDQQRVGAMAAARPDLFGGEAFGAGLARTTPEARAAASARAFEAEEVSQEAEETRERRQQSKREADKATDFAEDWARQITEAGNRQTDKALESTMRSDEAFNKQLEADRRRADTKAEHDRREADRNAARTARENTPEAMNRRRASEDANTVMAEEQRQNEYRRQQGATPFEAGELEQVKHKVMTAMPEARARGMNLAELVNWAMAMQANEIEEGMARGMGRQNRSGQNLGSRY